jgi:thiol:disulfide interchange protein DsbC
VKALEEAYQGKTLGSPSCDASPIDKNMELGRRLFIRSTPTLIFQNGKMMEGYSSPNTLENFLKLNAGL